MKSSRVLRQSSQGMPMESKKRWDFEILLPQSHLQRLLKSNLAHGTDHWPWPVARDHFRCYHTDKGPAGQRMETKAYPCTRNVNGVAGISTRVTSPKGRHVHCSRPPASIAGPQHVLLEAPGLCENTGEASRKSGFSEWITNTAFKALLQIQSSTAARPRERHSTGSGHLF